MRVLHKIEQIIREELDALGATEIQMTALWSREHWVATGRWDTVPVLFKIQAGEGREYALNATHEEIVTPLMREFIQSYKDLGNMSIYQFQTKFRNEARAKSGILRGREFRMKDMYSFHTDTASLDAYYEQATQTYNKIYERLGIGSDTFVVNASGWVFTSRNSHEFQTKVEIGEDLIFQNPKTGICYNVELAPSKSPYINEKEEMKALGEVEGANIVGVEDLVKFLWVPAHHTTKTLFFETETGEPIVAVVRGVYDVNELKLLRVIGCEEIKLASAETIMKLTGAVVGYAGLYNLPENIRVFCDESIEWMINFECGCNKTNFHAVNVNFWRDVKLPEQFYDIKLARIGDIDPTTGDVYETFKASEVGNIFPLETKYTDAFDVNYADAEGKKQKVIMGCYGLGVSRVMGVIAEKFMDDKGLIWPENIAPYSHYIIVHGEHLESAKKLASELEKSGSEVIIDDRNAGFGQKAGDADLLGIPNRIILSDKTLTAGGYELKKRTESEGKIIIL